MKNFKRYVIFVALAFALFFVLTGNSSASKIESQTLLAANTQGTSNTGTECSGKSEDACKKVVDQFGAKLCDWNNNKCSSKASAPGTYSSTTGSSSTSGSSSSSGENITILEGYSCQNSKFFPLFESAKFIIVVIQIAVPFGLVIWGSLDWFKALIAHDEKEMRMKRRPFISRVVAALIILILPWFMQLLSNIIAGRSDSVNFWTCYSEAKARLNFSKLREDNNGDSGNIIEGFGDQGTFEGESASGSSGGTSGSGAAGGSGGRRTTGGSDSADKNATDYGKCTDYQDVDAQTCAKMGCGFAPSVDAGKTGDCIDLEKQQEDACYKYDSGYNECHNNMTTKGVICDWKEVSGGGYCTEKEGQDTNDSNYKQKQSKCNFYNLNECEGAETTTGDICTKTYSHSNGGGYVCTRKPQCTDTDLDEYDCNNTVNPRTGQKCKWVEVSGGAHCTNP